MTNEADAPSALEALIARAEAASARMGRANPNRALLRDMAIALVTQARMVADLRSPADTPRIILP